MCEEGSRKNNKALHSPWKTGKAARRRCQGEAGKLYGESTLAAIFAHSVLRIWGNLDQDTIFNICKLDIVTTLLATCTNIQMGKLGLGKVWIHPSAQSGRPGSRLRLARGPELFSAHPGHLFPASPTNETWKPSHPFLPAISTHDAGLF